MIITIKRPLSVAIFKPHESISVKLKPKYIIGFNVKESDFRGIQTPSIYASSVSQPTITVDDMNVADSADWFRHKFYDLHWTGVTPDMAVKEAGMRLAIETYTIEDPRAKIKSGFYLQAVSIRSHDIEQFLTNHRF